MQHNLLVTNHACFQTGYNAKVTWTAPDKVTKNQIH